MPNRPINLYHYPPVRLASDPARSNSNSFHSHNYKSNEIHPYASIATHTRSGSSASSASLPTSHSTQYEFKLIDEINELTRPTMANEKINEKNSKFTTSSIAIDPTEAKLANSHLLAYLSHQVNLGNMSKELERRPLYGSARQTHLGGDKAASDRRDYYKNHVTQIKGFAEEVPAIAVLEVREADRLSFTCNTSTPSNPATELVWYRNGQKIESGKCLAFCVSATLKCHISAHY